MEYDNTSALRSLVPGNLGSNRSTPGLVHSPYLVQRYRSQNDENLFNHVKFHLITDALRQHAPASPALLDLGCADQLARRYLTRLGNSFRYCGVDYEVAFEPDIVGDLRDPEHIAPRLPWAPDVILLLDVLEHLDGRESDILQVLQTCRSILPPGGLVLVTVPQMYRLDRFKLPHLHYEEHKVRLRQEEWLELLSCELEVFETRGVGFLSVLPHLVMFSRRYRDDNVLGRLFRHLRGKTLERSALRRIDLWLSRACGSRPSLRQWANDVLFVCRRPAADGARS